MELEFHQLELRYQALRRTSPEQERRLLASLADKGQQTPIVVVKGEEAQRYVVVDGYKRIRGLKRLRQDTVQATVWVLEEVEALILERLMHNTEAPSALEQGWLLRELHGRFGLDAEELARRFDRSPSWVSRRLSLVKELPEEIQQRVRTGEIQPHAAMKYLVPLARANLSDCLSLLEGIRSRRLTTRQMGKLYAAYVSGDERTRELLRQQPLLFLKAEEEALSPLPVELTPFEGLKSDLNLLANVARRVLRRLRQGLGLKLRPDEREQTRWLYLQAKTDFEQLSQRCQRELTDAGSEHTNCDLEATKTGTWHPKDCASVGDFSRSCPQGSPTGQSGGSFDRKSGESRDLSDGHRRTISEL